MSVVRRHLFIRLSGDRETGDTVPMSLSETAVGALPTFAALDSYLILEQRRNGSSIQLDESYFRGQTQAIDAVETTAALDKRRTIVSQSRQLYNRIQIDFDSLTRETLESASASFRRLLQQLPEVRYLKQQFPATCFAIPEWIRSEGTVDYGARIYFFGEESAPTPDEILHRNIEAVVSDTRADFERYQGRLHGYPDCCVDWFSTYDRQQTTAPEVAAVDPIADCIDDDALQAGPPVSASVDELTDGLFETPAVYGFFTREFFPEPNCDRARRDGLSMYDALCEEFPDALVEDFFRLNAAWSYLMAQATIGAGRSERPAPGSLGREQLLFYLPLSSTVSVSKYVT